MGTLHKSLDGGGHWFPSGNGLSPWGGPVSISAVAVDPQIPTTVYAGTGAGFGGIVRSTDAGQSWSPFNTGLAGRSIRTLQISPSGACLHAFAYDSGGRGAVFDFATQADPCAPLALAPVVAAVLPSSRSVQVGTPATAFATIINAGASTAVGCGIAPLTTLNALFTFQTTDPATNQVMGTPNTPVNIAPGGAQTFVVAFTPTHPFDPIDGQSIFGCENTTSAPIYTGVNTLLLSASATPVPDIVALAATLANDGIVRIPGATGTGVFSAATVNVGVASSITVRANTGGAMLPLTIALCQTNAATGECLALPTSAVTTQVDAGSTPTFGVFVTGTSAVPFDPANSRIFIRFRQGDGVPRGATSVAVRTQ